MLILLLILILVFGFGGYRMGPGLGYYGGGGISLILLIVLFASVVSMVGLVSAVGVPRLDGLDFFGQMGVDGGLSMSRANSSDSPSKPW